MVCQVGYLIDERWNVSIDPVVDVSLNGEGVFLNGIRRNASGKDLCAGCGWNGQGNGQRTSD